MNVSTLWDKTTSTTTGSDTGSGEASGGGRKSRDKGEGNTGGDGGDDGADGLKLTLTKCVSCCLRSRSTTTTGADMGAGTDSGVSSGDGKSKGVEFREASEAQLLLSLLHDSYEHIGRSEEYERRLEGAFDSATTTANSINNANIDNSSFATPTRTLTITTANTTTADSFAESKDSNTQHTEHIQITDPDHPTTSTTLTGRPSITLTRINLTLHPGQLVAIVGQVGAGKSSLIHTILGEMNSIYGNIYNLYNVYV